MKYKNQVCFGHYFVCLTTVLLFSCSTTILEKGQILVLNGGDNTLQKIDLHTFEIKKTYLIKADSGYLGHHINLSPQKNFLSIAFPMYDFSEGHEGLHTVDRPGKVLVIPRKNHNRKRWIATPKANYNAIMNPEENEVWTSAYSHTGRVYVYDFPSGNLKKEIIVNPDPSQLILCKDDKYVAVACGESSFVTFIDTYTYEQRKDVKVDPYPGNVQEGFENIIFVQNLQRKSLNLIDVDKLKGVEFIDFQFTPLAVKYNQKTKEIWVSAEDKESIFVYKKDALEKWIQVKEISLCLTIYNFHFFNNYSKLAGISQKENQLIVLDTETEKIQKVIQTGKKPNDILVWE